MGKATKKKTLHPVSSRRTRYAAAAVSTDIRLAQEEEDMEERKRDLEQKEKDLAARERKLARKMEEDDDGEDRLLRGTACCKMM